MKRIDIVKLNFSNALLMGDLPPVLTVARFSEVLARESHADIGSFGLFETSSPNYTTYYPEVTAEDLKPKPSDFINPVFRALSEVIVHKKYNPIDFGHVKGILEESMPLLKGSTINVDHEMMTGNAIGAVADVAWEKQYMSKDGKPIPAGINAQLRIDGKSNPRLVRGINMDPPSIHSTSVTVEFGWDKSHVKLSDEDFFKSLGKLDDNGDMYRRVVNHIRRYPEISLVNHGADPYAQKIGPNGEINNPLFAHITYNSEQERSIGKNYYFFDFKALGSKEYLDSVQNNATIPENNNDISTNKTDTPMNKELILAMITLLALDIKPGTDGGFSEDQQGQVKLAVEKLAGEKTTLTTNLKTAQDSLTTAQTEITALKGEVQTLKTTAGESVSLKEFKDNTLTKLKAEVTRLYSLSAKNKPVQAMLDVIGNSDINALEAFQAQYIISAEEAFPATCKKCGSTEVSRASAQMKATEPEGSSTEALSSEDTMAKIKAAKHRSIANDMHGVVPAKK